MATVIPEDAAAELAQALGQVSETVTVKVGGKPRELTVTPFRLRQFARVLKCVQRMRDAGLVQPEALTAIAEGEDAKEAAGKLDILKMFLEGGGEIVNILIVAVEGQMKAEHVDALDLVDGARLASAVFGVNLDFFYQNRETIQAALAPAVKAVEKVADEGLDALGQPPLTDSSGPGTD
ncbi:MAG TPA: hypothetical protein VF659_01710 [Pyrinomonadaceae bacterium]|jgi:hypothetical protein